MRRLDNEAVLLITLIVLTLLILGLGLTKPAGAQTREISTLDECIATANKDSAQASAQYRLAYDKYQALRAKYNALDARYSALKEQNELLEEQVRLNSDITVDHIIGMEEPAATAPVNCVTHTIGEFTYTDCH